MKQRRRHHAQSARGRDREALDVFGFVDYPTHDELRRRYLELAKKLHPDAVGGSDDEFKHLSKAYHHLSDLTTL